MVAGTEWIRGRAPTYSGKVRDLYDFGPLLLMVASDRLSAFDVILPTPVPEKGAILTQLSSFWFEKTRGVIANHLSEVPLSELVAEASDRARLSKRAVVVKKTVPLKIEAVVRGYIAGSGLSEYNRTGSVSGIALPAGLVEGDRLAAPIFTPSSKAPVGEHDEAINFDEAVGLLGGELAERVRETSLALYRAGAAWAESRGIILADTKFEFGLLDGELVVIDEMLTPDSSRFWPADTYAPGGPQASFDKQYVRDYLLALKWDKTPPGPVLPDEVVAATRARYVEAYERLTGLAWSSP
ncbi:MAG: phosphoribosylaminoimidazolesuccinocarboxamide synthase [Deltaproteobacteria bacterium]|nr:phosphoribosylaminoimidazolesuccinocarboxamide synthase [Deltaproteobacteria bacterium]